VGENPELRTLFFRCAKLMNLPFLPLFVFDGPKRPSCKRGKRVGKRDSWMVNGLKQIIKAFGYEHISVSSLYYTVKCSLLNRHPGTWRGRGRTGLLEPHWCHRRYTDRRCRHLPLRRFDADTQVNTFWSLSQDLVNSGCVAVPATCSAAIAPTLSRMQRDETTKITSLPSPQRTWGLTPTWV